MSHVKLLHKTATNIIVSFDAVNNPVQFKVYFNKCYLTAIYDSVKKNIPTVLSGNYYLFTR